LINKCKPKLLIHFLGDGERD